MNKQIEIARQRIIEARHLVSFSGAGLSAESGIATFRDKDEDSLWSKFDPMQLASQEGFKSDPAMVIDWYNWRRKTLAKVVPNEAHKTLGNQSMVHITQNVDHLLEAGGATPERVLHLHGSLLEDRCNANCGYSESVKLSDPPGLRDCPDCGAYMRPSVVWFGEQLPDEVMHQAMADTIKADLFLVIGTSAVVYPAAGLISVAKQNGAEVIVVNTEVSEGESDIELIGKAGAVVPRLFN